MVTNLLNTQGKIGATQRIVNPFTMQSEPLAGQSLRARGLPRGGGGGVFGQKGRWQFFIGLHIPYSKKKL